ncbi:hypothetical protein PFISCL1PPCAC_16967, partial [Pristionchus fissidentatus]
LLGDSKDLQTVDSYGAVVDAMCSRTEKVLAIVMTSEVDLLPPRPPSCFLTEVPPMVMENGTLRRLDLFKQREAAFLLSPRIPRRWLDKLRFIHLSLYSVENRQTIFFKRYGSGRNKNFTTKMSPPNQFSPVSYERFSVIVYSFLGLLLPCLIFFVIETFLLKPQIFTRICRFPIFTRIHRFNRMIKQFLR